MAADNARAPVTITTLGHFSVVRSDIPTVAVPEASTWSLLLGGQALLAGMARRRSGAA